MTMKRSSNALRQVNSVAFAEFADVRSNALRFESEIGVLHHETPQPTSLLLPSAVNYPFAYDEQELTDLRAVMALHRPDPDGKLAAWAKQFERPGDGQTLSILNEMLEAIRTTFQYQRRPVRGTQDPCQTLGLPENEVGRWAGQFLPPNGSIGTFELLTRLSEAIHRGFRYQRREAKGIQHPVDTLRIGHGSCRDFAMLMIEAARSLGLAARFASGYLAVPLDKPEEPMSGSARGSTHAWAQIYLPGTGWIDFDPTSGRVGKSGLVTVAVVRNPHHATPLHGTFIGFPSDHLGMEVQVSITSGTPEAICATPQRSSRIQSTRLIDTVERIEGSLN